MIRDLKRIREWVRETCEIFGSQTGTSNAVADIFVQGLATETAGFLDSDNSTGYIVLSGTNIKITPTIAEARAAVLESESGGAIFIREDLIPGLPRPDGGLLE